MNVFCKKCGAENPDIKMFCAECTSLLHPGMRTNFAIPNKISQRTDIEFSEITVEESFKRFENANKKMGLADAKQLHKKNIQANKITL